nr:MAG TPA: hypothetical protein [Caudoviricetes sp.]
MNDINDIRLSMVKGENFSPFFFTPRRTNE